MITNRVIVKQIEQLDVSQLNEILSESRQENHKFLQRLIDEYLQCVNRFARSGEALFIAYQLNEIDIVERLIGICGLNIDPFLSDNRIGRVRHLYVLNSYRRRRVGQQLMKALINYARANFDLLTLRTESDIAARFYLDLGFQPATTILQATHFLNLTDLSVERSG